MFRGIYNHTDYEGSRKKGAGSGGPGKGAGTQLCTISSKNILFKCNEFICTLSDGLWKILISLYVTDVQWRRNVFWGIKYPLYVISMWSLDISDLFIFMLHVLPGSWGSGFAFQKNFSKLSILKVFCVMYFPVCTYTFLYGGT